MDTVDTRTGSRIGVEPLDAPLGALVTGVDLREPPGEEDLPVIEDALDRFGVLILREQDITPRQQVAFCEAFGELDLPPRVEDRLDGDPNIFVIGNPDDKAVVFAPDTREETEAPWPDLEWHADQSQYPVPTWISMMYGVSVPPEGGDTLFACTYSAYEALDEPTRRRYEEVTLLHSITGINDYLRQLGKTGTISKAELGREREEPQRWPLVRTHPRSGRRALYFGARVSVGAVGMDAEQGRLLIREVTELASRPEFVYRHRWRQGDAVLWDNRRVVHAATSFDTARYRRVIHRTTVRENTPIR